jgi:hypothetical protein
MPFELPLKMNKLEHSTQILYLVAVCFIFLLICSVGDVFITWNQCICIIVHDLFNFLFSELICLISRNRNKLALKDRAVSMSKW